MTDEFDAKKKLAGLIAINLSRFLPWQLIMPPYAPKNIESEEDDETQEEEL